MVVKVVTNPIVGGHGLSKQSTSRKTARKGQDKAVMDISLL